MELDPRSLLLQLRRLDTSSPEIINFLKPIVLESSYAPFISSLDHHDALTFMNMLDKALGSANVDNQFQERGLHALRRLCGRAGQLPSSYILTDRLKTLGDTPFASGGFGDVWKGAYGGRRVAIKLLRLYESSSANMIDAITKKFCKEVVTWKRLVHPNIVPFLGVSLTLCPFAIVSEWMPRGNVRQHVLENWDTNRLRLLVDIASGLDYLHSLHIVHGDLKGDNILIDDVGKARLADFGLASFAATANISDSAEGSFGTTQWMAPELFDVNSNPRSARPLEASDIYAFSMVTMEVFTGRLPFDQLQKEAVIFRTVMGHRPSRPAANRLGLSDNVWEMVQECWRAEPDQRPTISVVLKCLETAHGEFAFHNITTRSDIKSKQFAQELDNVLVSKYDALFQVHGQDAQVIIDTFDQAIDSPHLGDELRKRALTALAELCSTNGLFPSACMLNNGLAKSGDQPFAAGGFGDVWKGVYGALPVAIKVLRVGGTHNVKQVRKLLCKEAVIWKRLSHPNIVRFVGISTSLFHLCVVFEWMPNGNLGHYLRFNIRANRLRLLVDTADGLNYLHSLNIVHGCLKGHNILIDANGHARLCDFGATQVGADPSSVWSVRDGQGTVRWMAPELFDLDHGSASHVTQASDIYALAMVAIEVFTGNVPFPEWPNTAVIFQIMGGARPQKPTEAISMGLTSDLWDMVEACWQKDVNQRPRIPVVLDCFKKAAFVHNGAGTEEAFVTFQSENKSQVMNAPSIVLSIDRPPSITIENASTYTRTPGSSIRQSKNSMHSSLDIGSRNSRQGSITLHHDRSIISTSRESVSIRSVQLVTIPSDRPSTAISYKAPISLRSQDSAKLDSDMRKGSSIAGRPDTPSPESVSCMRCVVQ